MDRRHLRRALRDVDGIARTAALAEMGASRHLVADAVARGELIRVRRGWVALPDADPVLASAARRGVVLTCVTAAARIGLWVLDDGRAHVAAPCHAGRVQAEGAVVHWHRPPIPRHPDALVDVVPNILVAVARCQPIGAALAVWESALRQNRVTLPELRRLELPPAARRLRDEASPFSDSGLETLLPRRLRWLGLPLRQQVWLLGRPVDLLIGERLIVQIDGGHHVGAQRTADNDHDARLMLLGYHVIRVTYGQVIDRWETVHDQIVRAVAQGLHQAA